MGRLPTFSTATVDEVIDIRSELAPSLTQFRSAMVTISKSFSGAPWETNFADEVHDVWVENVLPAVESIDASVKDSSSLLSLATGITAAANTAYPGLAIVGTGLVGHLGAVAAVGGALAGVAPILQAVRNRKKADSEIRMQPFYFLYAADQALS
jgi:hypothetical protein